MILHTTFVTYNRLHLTKKAIQSFLDTVTVPFSLAIVDNHSDDGTPAWASMTFYEDRVSEWLKARGHARPPQTEIVLLDENRYPGAATNIGWSFVPPEATHLQRADNDMHFLPGWCEEVERTFARSNRIGQVGLRTDAEELHCSSNVGGNCVIIRKLWDMGLRWDERPWSEFPPGCSEDTYFSPAVVKFGRRWTRVSNPCLIDMATGDPDDPYYQKSYGDRRIW